MSKRLSDTAALSAQGIKEAGNEYASSESPYYCGEGVPLTPATGSADWAVGAEKRRQERLAMLRDPKPWVDPAERAEYRRETGAGNSSLSVAMKVARGEN